MLQIYRRKTADPTNVKRLLEIYLHTDRYVLLYKKPVNEENVRKLTFKAASLYSKPKVFVEQSSNVHSSELMSMFYYLKSYKNKMYPHST